jgi:hypothetical protein
MPLTEVKIKNIKLNNILETTPRQSVSGEGMGMADQLKNVLSAIRPKLNQSDDEDAEGADSDEWSDSD